MFTLLNNCHLLMKSFLKIIPFLLLIVNTTLAQSSWKETLENKKGDITINFYNSEHFISDVTGEIVGIEYDLLESFFSYCENKHQVEINRSYVKANSFANLYNNIKEGESLNEFAACSFSMTPERMEEVQFSPKYMPDIEVLICSHNIPLASDTAQFIELFKNATAFTIPNTTFDDDVQKIKNIIPSLKIENATSAIEIRDMIAVEDNLLSYIELPNYILALKERVNIKRQYLFQVERWGYGFIFPLGSDWKEPVEAYFGSPEFKNTMKNIIVKHLGDDVRELVLDLAKAEKVVGNNKEVSLLNKEREIQDLEIEKQKIQIENEKTFRYILILGVVFVLAITLILFKQNQINKKKKKLLQLQKDIIEEKNNHITDSIAYAKRIQKAALTSEEERLKIFPNSFILYKPKEALSGDFYWTGRATSETSGDIRIAAVGDCTGHGVPGALLSILGINYLNIASRSPNVNNCAEALDLVNQGVLDTFTNSSNEGISDGMDAVMLAVNMKTLLMNYASAINPVYIIRKKELIILKGDRFPIGKKYFEEFSKFKSIEYQLLKGDFIYLFSDGFSDQFGGGNDMKIGLKSFRELLLEISKEPIHNQEDKLNAFFENWRNDEEQTDDVCVFGLEV